MQSSHLGSVIKYLRYLRLAQNSFSGSLPWFIGNLSSLIILDLTFNSMNGTVLQNIGQLTRLFELNLYGNSWEGIITENHFWNLSRLYRFALSSISKFVIFNLCRDWVPSYSLSEIAVSNCQLGPVFRHGSELKLKFLNSQCLVLGFQTCTCLVLEPNF